MILICLFFLEVKGYIYIYILVLSVHCCQPVSLHPHARVLSHMSSWTAAHQAPLSMDFPGKNAGVGCHCLLQLICLFDYHHLRGCEMISHWRLNLYFHSGKCWCTSFHICLLALLAKCSSTFFAHFLIWQFSLHY